MQFAPTLSGTHVRLEPLDPRHIDALVAASAEDPALYQWSPVPRSREQATAYIETAMAWREAGTALPFAVIRREDNKVIGSTRFFLIEYWAWPEGHPRYQRKASADFAIEQNKPTAILPDACEIGYTWYARSAVRTAANTEAKLLMLTQAFESWQVFRVCLHADVRNLRSRAAMERIGGKCEGILRAHRMAADFIARDSARYSFIQSEWPEAKQRLVRMLER